MRHASKSCIQFAIAALIFFLFYIAKSLLPRQSPGLPCSMRDSDDLNCTLLMTDVLPEPSLSYGRDVKRASALSFLQSVRDVRPPARPV